MKEALAVWAFFALLFFGLVGAIWYEAELWGECFGQGHSFFYCLRVLAP